MVTADNKKLKSLIQAWGSKVTCSLDDDNNWQSYKVVGDSRVLCTSRRHRLPFESSAEVFLLSIVA